MIIEDHCRSNNETNRCVTKPILYQEFNSILRMIKKINIHQPKKLHHLDSQVVRGLIDILSIVHDENVMYLKFKINHWYTITKNDRKNIRKLLSSIVNKL